ncbi:13442_t:CDS:2, partial [Gigaspora margarita]
TGFWGKDRPQLLGKNTRSQLLDEDTNYRYWKQEVIEHYQRIISIHKKEKQDQSYITVPKNEKTMLKESKNKIYIIGAPKKKQTFK